MRLKTILTTVLGGLLLATAQVFAADVERQITKVAGDVYRFQNDRHFSLVTITDAGVVVVDPINAEAASWLKANLHTITDKPITHLIYSHSHDDHASGGQVFAAPNVITQKNAPEAIDGVTPTVRFAEKAVVQVGNHRFELTWLGEGHGEDMIAVVVRPENVGFITDVAAPKRLPYKTMPSSSVDAWIDQVRKVETLDFEIFAPAHGNVGVKADATDVRIYMETLRAEVLAGLKAGKDLAALKTSITMDAYRDWLSYDAWRELNVEGMADLLIQSGAVK